MGHEALKKPFRLSLSRAMALNVGPERLTNLRKIEYGTTEDYDPETSNLVITSDGKSFKNWAESPSIFLGTST